MRLRGACLAALLMACPEEVVPPDACTADGATLRVGTGTDSTARTWRELADGDMVYLTPGVQGAQHVWVGLRARGVVPTLARVELRAYREGDNVLVGQVRVRLPLVVAPEDPSWWALSSMPLVLDDDRYCSVLPGDLRIELDFDDGNGHCIHAARRVRLAGIDPLALEVDREARLRCCTQRLPRCYPDGGLSLDASVTDASVRD